MKDNCGRHSGDKTVTGIRAGLSGVRILAGIRRRPDCHCPSCSLVFNVFFLGGKADEA